MTKFYLDIIHSLMFSDFFYVNLAIIQINQQIPNNLSITNLYLFIFYSSP
jgi:hypothetical protein